MDDDDIYRALADITRMMIGGFRRDGCGDDEIRRSVIEAAKTALAGRYRPPVDSSKPTREETTAGMFAVALRDPRLDGADDYTQERYLSVIRRTMEDAIAGREPEPDPDGPYFAAIGWMMLWLKWSERYSEAEALSRGGRDDADAGRRLEAYVSPLIADQQGIPEFLSPMPTEFPWEAIAKLLR